MTKRRAPQNRDGAITTRPAKALSTHYHVLGGLHRQSTDREVHDAWRPLAAEFHPDKNPAFHNQAVRINQAYAALKTADARQRYHDLLDLTHSHCQTCDGRGLTKKQRGMTRLTVRCEVCAGSGVTL